MKPITAKDIGRQVRLENGEIETIVEFYPDRLRPVIIKDENGLFSARWTDGRLNLFDQRPEYNIVGFVDEEQPAPKRKRKPKQQSVQIIEIEQPEPKPATPITRTGVIGEVLQERNRQEAKWGEQNHPPIAWLAILGEEVGEVNRAVCEAYFPNYASFGDYRQARAELIQVAAVAVAMIESLDRNEVKPEARP